MGKETEKDAAEEVFGGVVRLESEQRSFILTTTLDALELAKKNPRKFLLAGLVTLIGFQLL